MKGRGLWLLLAISLPAAAGRRAVILDVDGVRRDVFETAWREGRLPRFARLLENAVWYENASAVFPSETLPGQGALFTGTWPGRHGIPGNSWYDRESGTAIEYTSVSGIACVYGHALLWGRDCGGGLANRHLLVPTLYQAASAAGKTSLVAFNHYWKGATRALTPSVLDALELVRGDSVDAEAFDRLMLRRLLAALEEPADIVTVYFAGADAVGHVDGNAAQSRYLSEVVDPALGVLLDRLDETVPGWQDETLFVLAADHGRTTALPFPEGRQAQAALDAALGRAGDPGGRVSFNGGMAHVYTSAPDATAHEITLSTLGDAIDSVLVREGEGYRVHGGDGRAAPELTLRLASARSGDVLILLKPGLYFGNQGTGSQHGSIHAEDLAVPLALAGGGLLAKTCAEPASTTQVASTIAAFLGFQMMDAEPPLPCLFFQANPGQNTK
ncbi:MAG: alkaline phosphatase family protein [Bryobacteraceae bacterium]